MTQTKFFLGTLLYWLGAYMLTGEKPISFEFIARPWDKYLGDFQMRRSRIYVFWIVAKNLEITRILPTGFYVDFT